MKPNVFTSIFIALFLFAIYPLSVRADSDAILYHNIERHDNVVSITYFKRNGIKEDLTPYKKRINTLNEEGNCISKVTYTWDLSSNTWIPLDMFEYTYDGTKVINIKRCGWNIKKNDWDKPQITSYNYIDDEVTVSL